MNNKGVCVCVHTQGLVVDMYGPSANSFDKLAAALSQLPNLRTLNISYSKLGNNLPASFAYLTQLQVLDLSYSYMFWNGPEPGPPPRAVPASWCNMTSLRVLKAERAGLGGTLDMWPVLGGCMSSLEALYLGGNWQMSGTLPAGKA